MTVLIIHNYYIHRGGEDAVFEQEYENLKKSGFSVYKYSVSNNETKTGGLFSKLSIFFKILNNTKIFNEIKKIIIEKNVTTVHIHNVFPLISPSIYKKIKKLNVKIVQTIHNYRFVCPNGQMFRNNKICYDCKNNHFFSCVRNKCFKNSYLFSLLYYYLIKRYFNDFKNCIDSYIVLNGFVENILINAGFDKNKFVLKGNSLNDTGFERKDPGNYFLYIGRLTEEKGIFFLLDFLSENKDFNFKIAGTSENFDFIKEKYTDCNNIEFVGFADDSLKKQLLQKANALVIPSIWNENYPVTIPESFREGIPVIASNSGGLPYIITDDYDGLIFRTEDAASLKECLVRLSDKALRNKLGDNARKAFIDKMEQKSDMMRLINIYS